MCSHGGTNVQLSSKDYECGIGYSWSYTRYCWRCKKLYGERAASGIDRKSWEIETPECFGSGKTICVKCNACKELFSSYCSGLRNTRDYEKKLKSYGGGKMR